MDATSSIDLGAGALMLHTDTPQQRDAADLELLGRVRSTFADGSQDAWSGPGLSSSSAVLDPLQVRGVALLANLDPRTVLPILTSLSGEPLGTNDVLAVGGVLYGDGDLDGKITADNYHRIDRAFLLRAGG